MAAFGHRNVQAIHPSTLMITKENNLSKQGDCIVVLAADKAVADLSVEFKDKLRNPNAKLTIVIEADGLKEQINAYGSPKLILTHPTDMVIRKSDYICSRTLAIKADKAANDLSRELVEKLKNPQQKAYITLIVCT
ncbi:DUF371 domain-containing protein [Candidatus Bathyarchaeota archaeon]|nr:DUF371 domain-containing protein [Candidatus Bathyarchaeota archaeon]